MGMYLPTELWIRVLEGAVTGASWETLFDIRRVCVAWFRLSKEVLTACVVALPVGTCSPAFAGNAGRVDFLREQVSSKYSEESERS